MQKEEDSMPRRTTKVFDLRASGQPCIYVHSIPAVFREGVNERNSRPESDDGPQGLPSNSNSTSERLNAIEARLEQIAADLGTRQAAQSPRARVAPRPAILLDPPALALSASDLTSETVNDGIFLYFRNHCNQPCPLLNFIREPLSHQYPLIVLNAMLALTLRRCSQLDQESTGSAYPSSERLAQRSWDLLTDSYRRFDFDESYFQALCLLAQVDHAEGRSDRARAQVSLGLRLAQSRGMLDEAHYEAWDGSGRIKQHQEIVLSLFILDRILLKRDSPNPSIPKNLYRLPAYREGPTHPDQGNGGHNAASSTSLLQNFTIVNSYVQMMYAWELSTQYISESLTGESQPIWHHKSSRTSVLTYLLGLEIPMEPHTYASVSPINRAVTEPNLRPYFQTWMFFQITHSAIHCCINHPFIIFIKTREHGSRVPLTFLQKAHKDSLIYASWIAKNLTDMDTANLDVLDPFLAYLVGIAGSTLIEHSLSSDASIAAAARQKITTCMAYLTRVSRIWPKVEKRIAALKELQSRVGHRSALNYVEDEYDGAVPVRSRRHVSMSPVDEQLMLQLFDSSNDAACDTSVSARRATESGSEQLSIPQSLQHESSHSIQQSHDAAAVIPQGVQGPLDPPSSDMDMNTDWSLLGMPWFAYFPPDVDLLGVNTC